MKETEPKKEVLFKNKVVVNKHNGIYYISVDGVVNMITSLIEDVQTWLEFNWPVGTRVMWKVQP